MVFNVKMLANYVVHLMLQRRERKKQSEQNERKILGI
jgi:hypothetical protein